MTRPAGISAPGRGGAAPGQPRPPRSGGSCPSCGVFEGRSPVNADRLAFGESLTSGIVGSRHFGASTPDGSGVAHAQGRRS